MYEKFQMFQYDKTTKSFLNNLNYFNDTPRAHINTSVDEILITIMTMKFYHMR